MKKILITGANRGLGHELVKTFLNSDSEVFVTGRNLEKLKEAYKEIRSEKVHFFEADINDRESLKSCYELLSKYSFDGIIHCASLFEGKYKTSSFDELEAWANSSLFASIVSNLALTRMTRGKVVFVGSIVGRLGKIAVSCAPYSVYKASLSLLSEAVSREGSNEGVQGVYINLGGFRDKKEEGNLLTSEVISSIQNIILSGNDKSFGIVNLMSTKDAESYLW